MPEIDRRTRAAVDHRPVRELADRHRDVAHRPDAMALIIVIEPGQAGMHRPQPRHDPAIEALRPAVAVPGAIVAVAIAAAVPVRPVGAGPGPGAVGVAVRGGTVGAAAQRIDRRLRRRTDAARPRGPGHSRSRARRTGDTSGLSRAALGLGRRIGGSIRTIVRVRECPIGSPLGVAGAGLGVGPAPAGPAAAFRMPAPRRGASVVPCKPAWVRRRAAPSHHLAARMAPPESLRPASRSMQADPTAKVTSNDRRIAFDFVLMRTAPEGAMREG